jgi:hypothetical protein
VGLARACQPRPGLRELEDRVARCFLLQLLDEPTADGLEELFLVWHRSIPFPRRLLRAGRRVRLLAASCLAGRRLLHCGQCDDPRNALRAIYKAGGVPS